MSIFESTHHMTPNEQEIFDIGYAKGRSDAVKHGEWICDNSDSLYKYHCSHCKKETNSRFYNYCPNCGARMDGES